MFIHVKIYQLVIISNDPMDSLSLQNTLPDRACWPTVYQALSLGAHCSLWWRPSKLAETRRTPAQRLRHLRSHCPSWKCTLLRTRPWNKCFCLLRERRLRRKSRVLLHLMLSQQWLQSCSSGGSRVLAAVSAVPWVKVTWFSQLKQLLMISMRFLRHGCWLWLLGHNLTTRHVQRRGATEA